MIIRDFGMDYFYCIVSLSAFSVLFGWVDVCGVCVGGGGGGGVTAVTLLAVP